MGKIHYVIDKEHGIVECILSNCAKDLNNRIINHYIKNGSKIYNRPYDDMSSLNKFIGIAKCLPEDEFDEETGKKLALLKAKNKRAKAFNRYMKKNIGAMISQIDALNDSLLFKDSEDDYDENTKHIKELRENYK